MLTCLLHISAKMQIAIALCTILVLANTSCSVTKHIPEEKSVVSKVNINVDGKPSSSNSLKMAVQQKPYHRTFGFLPAAALIWHNDTDTPFHKWRNKVGSEPLAYDEEKTLSSERSMLRTLSAQGYLQSKISHKVESNRRKATVTYIIDRGLPKVINDVKFLIEDPALEALVASEKDKCSVAKEDLLDRNRLEDERNRLTTLMRENGFWDFNKDDVSFIADTVRNSQIVDLSILISGMHEMYTFGQVHFVTNFNILTNNASEIDVTKRQINSGYDIQYEGEKCYLRDNTLIENCYIVPGNQYKESAVRNTYSAYSRLHLLKYTNIRLEPTADNMLEVFVYTSPQNENAIQFELDGTNTSGDLGVAGALTYQHRNLFHGSETYSLALRGGYESLTGNVAGLVNDNYSEYSIENTLDIPKFIIPFLSDEAKRRSKATTAVDASFSFQTRPEYTRYITNLGFSYKWQSSGNLRHTWDVIDLSYVYLPKRSESFIEIIEQAGPISYSSYSSHLIMSMGYNMYLTNQRVVSSQSRNDATRDVWSLRMNAEIAGNLLWVFSKIAKINKDENGNYNIFGLPFEQYARFDTDWSYSKYLTDRSRLAFHLAGGIAVPYGNSKTVPFEKRYYAGGANSVRGWSVRRLGPGSYGNPQKSNLDYFNQCGDVRFDAAVELRSKLFWKIEFASFVDAGNVWTLKNYTSQPGGKFDKDFYKDIAASVGLGIRMITDFVVIRLDMGIKAYNPYYSGSEAWTIKNPLKSENRAIHFAVGYPF